MIDAALGPGFRNDGQHIDADFKPFGDGRSVDVVGRRGAQFGHPAMLIPDAHIGCEQGADDHQAAAAGDHDESGATVRHARDAIPEPMETTVMDARRMSRSLAHGRHDRSTGKSPRLVSMIAATPRLAAMAIS